MFTKFTAGGFSKYFRVPEQPAPGVRKRADFAAFTAINRLNRNKFDPETALDKRQEHLRFIFEMARRRSRLARPPQINQAKSALRIRQGAPRVKGQTGAHGAIGGAARPGH
jgi:uncharacterized protein YfkK (UPF0435 family)